MTNNLIDTLKNMNVTNVHDVEYMALYTGSKTLDALEVLGWTSSTTVPRILGRK